MCSEINPTIGNDVDNCVSGFCNSGYLLVAAFLYTDEKVAVYRMLLGEPGAIARPKTHRSSSPELIRNQLSAPSVLLNTPVPSVPT